MPEVTRHKDAFVWWIASGLIGTVAQDIYSLFALIAGITDTHVWAVAASLAISAAEADTTSALVVGALIDTVIGGLFGLLIGVLLEWRGTSNYLVKGLTVALAAWVFCYGILCHNLPFSAEQQLVDLSGMISSFIGHVIYGVVTVIVYVKWLSKYA